MADASDAGPTGPSRTRGASRPSPGRARDLSWLGLRVALAVALMVGFYVLAIGIGGGLLSIPVVEYLRFHRIPGRLALFSAFLGGTVLWAILPRFDRFSPPGPALSRDGQPRLFDLIDEVARRTGQRGPSEVFLVPDLNAWVAQRGGAMGIGSRRVMGLGLPLLHLLAVDELRAVIAHEFGHFHGGDTGLGPWVYKTRAALARTILALESDDSMGHVIVQAPFKAYGAFFLRVTQAVSRAQEYAADALAARLVGAPQLASGLRVIHATGPLYDAFWQSRYAPLLSTGLAPPLGDGFRRFVDSDRMRPAVEEVLREQLERSESGPNDTHPALGQRLEALGQLEPRHAEEPPVAASSLLSDAAGEERRLLVHILGEGAAAALERIDWAEAGPRFYRPRIEAMAAQAAPSLRGVTPATLPGIARRLAARGSRLHLAQPGESFFHDPKAPAAGFVGAALTAAALRAGGEIDSSPPRPVAVRVSGDLIDFFEEFERLRSGKGEVDRWLRLAALAGIADADLGAAGPAAPPGERGEDGGPGRQGEPGSPWGMGEAGARSKGPR